MTDADGAGVGATPTSDARRSPTSISLPLAADTVRELRSGDSVLLSGPLVTGRDAAHARFAAAIEAGEDLPFDPAGETLYFVGPTPARPGHAIGAAGPTTASRMDAWSPLLVERGLRAMIGKGRRSDAVKVAMREHGCVYLGAIEGTAALLSQCVTSSEVIAYSDLGAEAVHRLEVRDFPALVVNDLHDGDLYVDGPARWRRASS
ncbi:fumarate hydratase C-terminal domain-containing protein [Actinomycetospora chibensis]|uniref:Fumarate hydratase C-terminal domain-containing protein n=1 Tax=Actinomycetospora chibensis TaxID=663606 RepID=A0ABV9RGP8_9PSEU|nr:fumarate hydratase C-terminal domain-containing protein [Actinomycetospora chibensis]MDD7924509.1 fumarate hydratase C-terminal domain-containing protein [Actinomycetospora chibensis]